jgi:CRISPR-associated endonuclease Cas1
LLKHKIFSGNPDMNIPPLVLLHLQFQVQKPILHLPHFHGGQWSAFFRYLLKPWLPDNHSLNEIGFSAIPLETGILQYYPGEIIGVDLIFPESISEMVASALDHLPQLNLDGHFNRDTLALKSVTSLLTRQPWNPAQSPTLDLSLLQPEIDTLIHLNEFTLHFYTPFRSKRPQGMKEPNHSYFDEDFFTDPNSHALTHFYQRIRLDWLPELDTPLHHSTCALQFIDCIYGKEKQQKTFGGVAGKIKITGQCNPQTATALVLGQYVGAGLSASFGFGFYRIDELNTCRRIQNIQRETTLLTRGVTPDTLRQGLKQLKADSSIGADGITLEDLQHADVAFFDQLSHEITQNTYQYEAIKRSYIPKSDNSLRPIELFNTKERMIQRTLADIITPIIDDLLTAKTFAYRKEKNRQLAANTLQSLLANGYETGFKADISHFFSSIDINKLAFQLQGIFPFDPIVDFIIHWCLELNDRGIDGLSQGSALSPVLSNLYLNRFDRDTENLGLKIIRYADDFVLLSKNNAISDTQREKVNRILADLNLQLNPDKTIEIHPDDEICFLGQLISKSAIRTLNKTDDLQTGPWDPALPDTWTAGFPVYLTHLTRGAFSENETLVIENSKGQTQKIPWASISRIIVIGRASFSGGVIYRAVREAIPVSFIDIMGRTTGSLLPENLIIEELFHSQRLLAKDPARCLALAKEVVCAKIHNCSKLLEALQCDATALIDCEHRASQANSIDSLRGHEGTAARLYFEKWPDLVAPFTFQGRHYHPPKGEVNVLLSFGYTLLYNRIANALRNKGFNPKNGFYHQGRGSHAALASDLMENLRPYIDETMIQLIQTGTLTPSHFTHPKNASKTKGNYQRLEGEGFRTCIRAFEEMMEQTVYNDLDKPLTFNCYLDELVDAMRRVLKLGFSLKPLRR